jgi:hypothetical protein
MLTLTNNYFTPPELHCSWGTSCFIARLSFRNNLNHYSQTHAFTTDTHAVFSLFLDQNTWCDVLKYIHLQPLNENYGFFCNYLLLSEDKVYKLLCLSYTVLCLGHLLMIHNCPWTHGCVQMPCTGPSLIHHTPFSVWSISIFQILPTGNKILL